jgi:nitronate monooxygenase
MRHPKAHDEKLCGAALQPRNCFIAQGGSAVDPALCWRIAMSTTLIATLQTPVCELLGCDVPVILAGMGGVARCELAAAVSEAGGFAFLGMVRESPDLIRSEIGRVRKATKRGFGVNLVPAATPPDLLEAELEVVIAERIAAVTLFWDLRSDIVRRLRDSGCLVLCQVGSVKEAEEAVGAGAHIVIAQGFEAGGHVRGTTNLTDLVHHVVARVDVPVLAAGGIVDGGGLAAALLWGAQGAVIGTGFLATKESFAHEYHKRRIVEATPGETIHTDAFHVHWPKGAAVRVLPNSVTRGEHGNPFSAERQIIGQEEGRPIYLFSTDSPLRDMTGDFEAMALYAGEGAGLITSIPSAAERLNAMVGEAMGILGIAGAPGPVEADEGVVPEFSSPACLMHEASDAYMGYAGKDQVISFLNELLEAERAGARVTLESARAAGTGPLAELLRTIQRDEARWCAMLHRRVKALGEKPSLKIGAFYGKAMAVTDLRERIAFLNRGQGWVVRKLREMLPRIRDDGLHTDLSEMLRSHEVNIALANETGK